MKREIGSLTAEIYPPENPKFKSPLILVHGLWSGDWSWHEWAHHWSNLGWECWAVKFRGRGERAQAILPRLAFGDWVNDLRSVVRESPSPPLLLAHDLGGLAAMKVAEGSELSALILVASLPPAQIPAAPTRTFRLLRLKYAPLIFLRRSFRPTERDVSEGWLSSVAVERRRAIFSRMVPESSHLASEFFYRSVRIDPACIRCPTLLAAGTQDRLVALRAFHEMGSEFGAEFLEYPNHGHWILEEGEGQRIVRQMHRWVVQKLGESILLAEFSQEK